MNENLKAALERLIQGSASPEDIYLLQQAYSSGKITFASQGGVAIAGNVDNSTIQTGDIYQLSPEAFERLFPTYEPPELPDREQLPESGILPPGSRLPFTRNAVFTGRREDLLSLAKCLLYNPSGSDVVVTQTAAVATGLGGIGKSQLAVEFCYRYGRYFQGVHWLQANQDISAEMAVCGAAMQLKPWPTAQPDQVALTLQAWSQGHSRLVVLDNAEDLVVLQEWLPQLGNCRVLLTARRGHWPADLGLQTYPLGTLPRPESLTLLRKLAPRLQEITDDELDPIAEHLGDLPLALDLAGRYLEERSQLSPEAYQAELETEESYLLQHPSLLDWVEYNPTQHETSLTATFLLSWNQVTDDLAQRLFKICGYCAPNIPIPREVLLGSIGAAESKELREVDRSLRDLINLGLLKPGEPGPSLHPLLAEFARLQDPERACLLDLVKTLGNLASEANQTGLPERFQPFRAHVRTAAEIAQKTTLEEAGWLWNEFGYHLKQVAEYAGARAAYERALAIFERFLPSDHPNIRIVRNNLNALEGK